MTVPSLARGSRLLAGLALVWAIAQGPVLAEPTMTDVSQEATASSDRFEWLDYQDPADGSRDPGPLENALTLLLRLGIVVGLAYGAAFLVKKGIIPRNWLDRLSVNSGDRGFRTLAMLPLRGNQTLHLVEVGDRILVLGSDGKNTLVKLSEWSSEHGAESFRKWLTEAEPAPDFADEVEDTLRRLVRPTDGPVS